MAIGAGVRMRVSWERQCWAVSDLLVSRYHQSRRAGCLARLFYSEGNPPAGHLCPVSSLVSSISVGSCRAGGRQNGHARRACQEGGGCGTLSGEGVASRATSQGTEAVEVGC